MVYNFEKYEGKYSVSNSYFKELWKSFIPNLKFDSSYTIIVSIYNTLHKVQRIVFIYGQSWVKTVLSFAIFVFLEFR